MNIRLAKKSDIWLLYNWVNKPDSIKNKMITSKDISKSEHILWYETSFDNKNRFIWIIEEDKVALGQIRFDIEEEKKLCFIDIYLEKKYRKKNIGKKAIFKAINSISRKRSINYFVALVVKSNMNSFNFFSNIGFTKYKTNKMYKMYYY